MAFGIMSLIELASGAILLLEAPGGSARRPPAAGRAEGPMWVVGIALALLSAYILVTAIYGLAGHQGSESSPVGIGISVVAVIVVPYLTVRKHRIASWIQSEALEGDAASNLTCPYIAGTVLVGLVVNALFHSGWAESLAALLFLFWLVRETCEVFGEARRAM